jgi:hypothetical protein
VVFVAIGVIPLLIVISARRELRTEGSAAMALRFAGMTRAPSGSPDDLTRLERLAELHRSGDLTDEEFAAAKRRLLGLES